MDVIPRAARLVTDAGRMGDGALAMGVGPVIVAVSAARALDSVTGGLLVLAVAAAILQQTLP